MVQILAKPITLTEFLAKPETKPASEFIGGQIITKPMPQGRHSTIQGELLRAINDAVKPSRTAYSQNYAAPLPINPPFQMLLYSNGSAFPLTMMAQWLTKF